MSRIAPGFRGIAVIDNTKFFRVSSIDIQKRQEAQQFLPAVGGRGLKRIWFKGTSDTAVTITAPLVEGMASYLHDLAYEQTEFYIDANYFGSKTRRAIGCKIDNLAFNVSAGDIVQVTINMVAKNVIEKTVSHSYTKGEKLVTWDKVTIDIIGDDYPDNDFQGFTYNLSNGIKTIKTAASLDPNVLTTAIQDISGQFQFYNFDDLGLPLSGTSFYSLGFRDVIFRIEDLTVRHNVVFNPAESIPLTTGPVVSVVTWIKSDDFYP